MGRRIRAVAEPKVVLDAMASLLEWTAMFARAHRELPEGAAPVDEDLAVELADALGARDLDKLVGVASTYARERDEHVQRARGICVVFEVLEAVKKAKRDAADPRRFERVRGLSNEKSGMPFGPRSPAAQRAVEEAFRAACARFELRTEHVDLKKLCADVLSPGSGRLQGRVGRAVFSHLFPSVRAEPRTIASLGAALEGREQQAGRIRRLEQLRALILFEKAPRDLMLWATSVAFATATPPDVVRMVNAAGAARGGAQALLRAALREAFPSAAPDVVERMIAAAEQVLREAVRAQLPVAEADTALHSTAIR